MFLSSRRILPWVGWVTGSYAPRLGHSLGLQVIRNPLGEYEFWYSQLKEKKARQYLLAQNKQN